MKNIIFAALAVAVTLISCTAENLNRRSRLVTDVATEQIRFMDSQLGDFEMPKNYKDSIFTKTGLTDWVSGFFPGTCWYEYQLSGLQDIKKIAERQTEKMLDVDNYYRDHDIGFQIMCSAGLAYKITGNPEYLPPVRHAAELLADRFSPITGTIKSWDNTKFGYPVIIDNMMNLELLTFASRQFGVPEWEQIARTHANNTMMNHFRSDGSTYHLVDYDPVRGGVVEKRTVQGYADSSAWSRGQSWSLYGFTMMYRETGVADYLAAARNCAAFLMPLLADKPVPAWDFDSPEELSSYDDASAGAIMASAFIELGTLVQDTAESASYLRQAERILLALSSPEYMAEPGRNGGFILMHSTGNMPRGKEIDVALTYADYYFMEAWARYAALDSK